MEVAPAIRSRTMPSSASWRWTEVVGLLVHVVAVACLAGLAFLTAMLVSRRLSGGMAAPLAEGVLFASGVLLAALTLVAQQPILGWMGACIANRRSDNRSHTQQAAALAVPLLIAFALIATLLYPGTTVTGVVALTLPLVVAEGAALWRWRRASGDAGKPSFNRAAITSEVDSNESRWHELDESAESLPADVSQRWTRRGLAVGEILEGVVRAPILRGMRVTNVHLAICPALATAPDVMAEAIEGLAASIKVAEAFSFGVRLELRLEETARGDGEVVIAVMIRDRCENG